MHYYNTNLRINLLLLMIFIINAIITTCIIEIYLSQVSKKNKMEVLHNSTVETSEIYKILLLDDLDSFRSY